MSKLSEVFSKLTKKTPGPIIKKGLTGNRNNRIVAKSSNQKGNRNAKLNEARGVQIAPNKPVQNSKKRTPQSKAAINKPKSGKGKKNQKGKGNDGKGSNSKKPADKDDLDKDMDKYWFKAGKGPDPDLVQLDNQLDAYKKQAVAVASAPPTDA